MLLARWIRRHRLLTAFAGGVLLTLAVLAAAGYYILSDQRRSAAVLARALSQALAREVRIQRVTEMGTERVVMRGVALPREGGWPATIVADRVEATGPLLAAARGDAAPVRLTVTRPTVDVGAEGGVGLAGLPALAAALRSALASPLLLDVRLAGGTLRPAGGAGSGFDLALLKERGAARGELTLRDGATPPLGIRLDARLDGAIARLALRAGGGLGPLAGSLPAGAGATLRDRALELRLMAEVAADGAVTARGHAAIGADLVADGAASFEGGVLGLDLSSASVDLGFGATVAGLAWRPSGRAELTDATARWSSGGGQPTVRALVRIPALGIPADAAGGELTAERFESRVALDPVDGGLAVGGEARAARVRAAGLEVVALETRYHVRVNERGGLAHAQLDGLAGRVEGAALRGGVSYDGARGSVDARLGGERVEAADLARRLVPGWLGPADSLRLGILTLVAAGVDVRGLERGTARLEAKALRLDRGGRQLSSPTLAARAALARGAMTLAVDADAVASTLPALAGTVPRLSGTATLVRGADGFRPERAELAVRDGAGRDLVAAALAPAPTAGRRRLTASAPALERLDGLWPDLPRRLNGSARLDVELSGSDLGTVDGRLAVAVPEAALGGGKVAIRDLTADLPIRRGDAGPTEPPWGTVTVGELIGYGVVVRDVTTPARVWRDRLSLNDLAYVLYSGAGKGWGEVAFEPEGPSARGHLEGSRVRIEELVASYGIRGGTMTGLMQYGLDYQYRAGRLALNGRFEVPDGGKVNIELLNRVLNYAESDPTGVVRRALENLREFDYKHALAEVRSAGDDIRVSLSLQGRERFLLFPPKVREINVQNMPLSFLARQFPGS